MPIPLIAISAAYAAGGQLVAHSSGGMIMSVGGSYVAATYLSTSAITALWASGLTLAGAGAVAVTGAAASVIGSAGIFGTSIGSSGLIGLLMGAGIVSSTPLWVPVALGSGLAGVFIGIFRYLRLSRKLRKVRAGEETHFTPSEVKLVERMLVWLQKNQKPSSAP